MYSIAISAILPNLPNLVFHFVLWKSPSSAKIEKKNVRSTKYSVNSTVLLQG